MFDFIYKLFANKASGMKPDEILPRFLHESALNGKIKEIEEEEKKERVKRLINNPEITSIILRSLSKITTHELRQLIEDDILIKHMYFNDPHKVLSSTIKNNLKLLGTHQNDIDKLEQELLITSLQNIDINGPK